MWADMPNILSYYLSEFLLVVADVFLINIVYRMGTIQKGKDIAIKP
jgi:hypothetical protein